MLSYAYATNIIQGEIKTFLFSFIKQTKKKAYDISIFCYKYLNFVGNYKNALLLKETITFAKHVSLSDIKCILLNVIRSLCKVILLLRYIDYCIAIKKKKNFPFSVYY